MKDTPTLSIYEKLPDAEYSGWAPVICVLEKIDSMLAPHGNFSKVKMASQIRPNGCQTDTKPHYPRRRDQTSRSGPVLDAWARNQQAKEG